MRLSLLGNKKIAGAEGGTSISLIAVSIFPASQRNPLIPLTIQSRQTLLGLYFVDAKRTR